jgi:ADP-heptose:LPS heptosyltransferase
VYRLHAEPEALEWASKQLQERPRPWLAVVAGARWPTKRWPPRHFAALLGRALEDFGGTAIFLGSRDETELARRTIELLPPTLRQATLDLSAATTLLQLAAVLSLADVVIANDTGPLHLAVALGRPVVAP